MNNCGHLNRLDKNKLHDTHSSSIRELFSQNILTE